MRTDSSINIKTSQQLFSRRKWINLKVDVQLLLRRVQTVSASGNFLQQQTSSELDFLLHNIRNRMNIVLKCESVQCWADYLTDRFGQMWTICSCGQKHQQYVGYWLGLLPWRWGGTGTTLLTFKESSMFKNSKAKWLTGQTTCIKCPSVVRP